MHCPSKSFVLATIAGTCLTVSSEAQFDAVVELSALNGLDGFVLNGASSYDNSGVSVSSAGDVNGDGIADIIIGAHQYSKYGSGSGESYVVFGGTTIGSTGSVDLGSLDGSNGYVLDGIDAGDYTGASVSSAGDVNGDGIDDLIIGAPQNGYGTSGSGESYVVFGGSTVGSTGSVDLASLNGSNGFVLCGVDSTDGSGGTVSSAGDVNGDGVDDIIIGAAAADPGGESYVVFGGSTVGSTGSVDLASLNGSNGFVLNGIDGGDGSGGCVSSAGDLNDDGVDDLIIGAASANFFIGESYVIFGGANVGSTGSVNLSALNGANGFVASTAFGGFDFGGDSVSTAGDVNGDGIDDVIIGASGADLNGLYDAGQSYVIFGWASVGTGGVIELGSLDGTTGYVVNGTAIDDRSGRSVSSAGDMNGDGIDDMIIGAPQNSYVSSAGTGKSYVVFGGASVGSAGSVELSSLDGMNGFVLNGIDDGDYTGSSVSSAGDVNGDGIDDVIIGAYRACPNGRRYGGESYVVFGRDNDGLACPADVNGDGDASPADFTAWLGCFNSPALPSCDRADVNGDGSLTPADFTAWLAAFNAGCD